MGRPLRAGMCVIKDRKTMADDIRFLLRILAVIAKVVVVLAFLFVAAYVIQVERIEREVSLEMGRYGWPHYQRTELSTDSPWSENPLANGHIIFDTGCRFAFIGYVHQENGHWTFDRLNPLPAADEGCTAEDYEAMR